MEYYIISDIRNSDVDLEKNDQKVSLCHIFLVTLHPIPKESKRELK